MVKKDLFVVTIVGAESSGKTVLAKQLAAALSCKWVPEFAREYLEKLERPYEFEDLEVIAKGEWDLMMEKIKDNLSRDENISAGSEIAAFLLPGDSANIDGLVDLLKSINREIIIVDSGMLTMRMWAQIKYDREIPFVEQVMQEDPASLYLLCRPRREWESDPLREAPILVDRVWIYNQYLKEIVEKKFDYKIIQR